MADSKTPTHTAYALRRLSKTHALWLEVGKGRLDSNGVFHGFLDRTVIGGFSGYLYFAPLGSEPPLPEPERPAQSVNDTEEEDL